LLLDKGKRDSPRWFHTYVFFWQIQAPDYSQPLMCPVSVDTLWLYLDAKVPQSKSRVSLVHLVSHLMFIYYLQFALIMIGAQLT